MIELVELEVTHQDKRFHNIVLKIAGAKEFSQLGMSRSNIYRVRTEPEGFIVEKKPASGRIYKPMKVFPTVEGALKFIHRCVWIASPEYKQHANDQLRATLERQHQRQKNDEPD